MSYYPGLPKNMEAWAWGELSNRGIHKCYADKIFGLLKDLERVCPFFFQHSLRVAWLTTKMGAFLSSGDFLIGQDSFVRACLFAGLGHDVGKALIPSHVLDPLDGWSPEKQALMKDHVWYSYLLLAEAGLHHTADSAVLHHTFQDKDRAYPAQEELPELLHPYPAASVKLTAKLTAIADFFDAAHRIRPDGTYLSGHDIRSLLLREYNDDADLIASFYEAGILSTEVLID